MPAGSGQSGAVRAGKAVVELGLVDKVTAALQKLRARFANVGKSLAVAGGSLIAGGGAVLGPLAAAFKGAIDRGQLMQQTVDRLGGTVEQLSAFAYAAETTGVSFDQLMDNLENWPERLTEAAAGGGEMFEVFRAMGVGLGELQSVKRLPWAEQMIWLAETLRPFANHTERLMALGKAMSDKGQGMNALMKLGGAGIRDRMAEAGEVGAVVSTEEAQQAAEVMREFNKVMAVVHNTVLSVGAAVLPTAKEIAGFSGYVVAAGKAVRQWVAENRQTVMIVAAVAAGVVAAGAAVLGLGAMFAAASFAVGGLVAVLAAVKGTLLGLVSPWALVAGGVYVWTRYTESGQAALSSLLSAVNGFVEPFKTAWAGIQNALAAGDLGLAARIAMAGLNVAWQSGIGSLMVGWQKLLALLQEGWTGFKGFFVEAWKDGVYLVQDLALEAAGFILSALTDVGYGFKSLLNSVLSVFGQGLGRFFGKLVSDALKVMEKGARMVGASGVADQIKGVREGFDNARWFTGDNAKQIEADRQAAQKEITAATVAAQKELSDERTTERAADAAARKADLDAAQAGVTAAEEKRDAAVAAARAELTALTAEAKAKADAAAKPKPGPPQVAAAARAALFQFGETKGQFGGALRAGSFGFGDSVGKQLLTSNQQVAKNTAATKEAVEKVEGLSFTR